MKTKCLVVKNEMMLIKEMKPSMYYVRMLLMGIEVAVKFTTSFILILQVHFQLPLPIFVIYIRLNITFKINRAEQK